MKTTIKTEYAITPSVDEKMPAFHSKKPQYISLSVRYLMLTLVSLFFLFPFFVLLTRCFMTDDEVLHYPVLFFPASFLNFDNFLAAVDVEMLGFLRNTLIVVVVNIFAIPFTASLCAYGFAKVKFQGRNLCFAIMMATMMLPFVVTQIPLFVIYVKLGWFNSLLPLTIPALFGGGALNIFLLRQFMRNVPREISEAARVDGANQFRIYWQLIMPACKPVIAMIMVQTFIGSWNDFLGPLLFLREARYLTLALGIYNRFNSSNEIYANVQMATGLLMLLPCAILFFIFQKQLIEGVTLTGIKG